MTGTAEQQNVAEQSGLIHAICKPGRFSLCLFLCFFSSVQCSYVFHFFFTMSNITGALMPHAPFDLKKGAAEALFNTIAHGQSPRTTNVLNTPGIVESFI